MTPAMRNHQSREIEGQSVYVLDKLRSRVFRLSDKKACEIVGILPS